MYRKMISVNVKRTILESLKKNTKIGIPLLFIFLFSLQSFAQKTCTGIVLDYDTEEPISFASIWIKHSNKGCLTQLDGSFSITLYSPQDTLIISAVGYQEKAIEYSEIKTKEITIRLIPAAIILEATVIRPGKNKAIPIVKQAIKNRRENSPDRINEISYLEYNKLTINLSDFDSSIFNNKFVQKHPEILIKANDYDSTWSIPLYFSERLSYQKKTADNYPESVEIAKNQYGSAFINSDITTKYINSLNQDLTFYGNLRFLTKDFISPISPQALIYYEYYLRDSIKHENTTYYQIKFKPKNAQDLVFYGYMVIEKNTGVLTDIQATLKSEANINYVKSIHIHEQLQQHPISGKWFFKQQKLDIEFTPQLGIDTTTKGILNTPLRAVKKTSYTVDSIRVNATLAEHYAREATHKKRTLATSKDTAILAEHRPDSLTTLDIQTRDAIEISNSIPAVQTTNKLLDMFLYGYLPLQYVELGPYLYFVQHNEIEGYRINLAARTSPQLHESMMYGGYIGYGFRDKEFKFGGKFAYKLPTRLLGILHASYDQNIYRIGDYKQNLDYVRENVLVQSDDNLLSALTSKSPNKAVYFVQKSSFAYEQQVNPNLIVKPKIELSDHSNAPYYNFSTPSNDTVNHFIVQEASINFRLSFREEISNNHFRRIYIDSRYPVFHLNMAYGRFQYQSTFHDYSQIRLVAKQDILLLVGRLKYVVESGLSLNPMPFPLLEFHRGNETGSSGEYYYNLMNYLEFGSDRFINVYAEYGMNGFIYNKIPVIKKLNLRELITFKACWGDLRYDHERILSLPEITKAPTKPYMEIGVGITNVFKIIRLEYIWRLNYRNEPDTQTEGLFFRFQLEF